MESTLENKVHGNNRHGIINKSLYLAAFLSLPAASDISAADIYFSNPYGGLYKSDEQGNVSLVDQSVGITGMSFDRSGNLYFGAYGDHRVDLMQRTPQGNIFNLGTIVQVGSVGHTWSLDLALGDKGEIYFSHPYGGLGTYTPEGQVTVNNQFVGDIASMSFSGDTLYLAERQNRTAVLTSLEGSTRETIGAAFTLGSYGHPWTIDVAAGNNGSVYFTHPYGGIYQRTADGTISALVSPDVVGSAGGLVFDGANNLYFGKYGDHSANLMKFSLNGELSDLGTIIRVQETGLSWNMSIAVAPVPEPATSVLLGCGLLALLVAGTQKKQK